MKSSFLTKKTIRYKHSQGETIQQDIMTLCQTNSDEVFLFLHRNVLFNRFPQKSLHTHQSLFKAAFLLLDCLPTASTSGKGAIRGSFVDEDGATVFELDAVRFSFLRAELLDPLPVAGVCSSVSAWNRGFVKIQRGWLDLPEQVHRPLHPHKSQNRHSPLPIWGS